MASNGYLPALVFCPEQGLNRLPKVDGQQACLENQHVFVPFAFDTFGALGPDAVRFLKRVQQDSQHLLPNYELRNDVIRSSPLNKCPQQNVGPRYNHHFDLIDPTITKPALINIQDCCPNSTLFSFKFPMSGLIEVQKDVLDVLSLSDLTGLQPVTTDHSSSQLIFRDPEFDSQKHLIDFVGDLVRQSKVKIHEDGHVSLNGTRTEMKDILSVLAEFYVSKSSTNWQKSLIPQFNRLDYSETSHYTSAYELETVTVAPPKSPEKMNLKPSPKKKRARNKTIIKDRSNYIRACESLLSIIVDKNRNGKSAIPVLKKSGPELPNLLTQFSASIAGTGIAVLFSVMCKVASGRVPFCSSKLLNTGLGLGLVWLSWAVNRLRDTVVMIIKNSNKKQSLKDEEMMKKLDRSVKEIYFRAAALMAVMVLRLA